MTEIIHMFGSPSEKTDMGGKWIYTYKRTMITTRSTSLPYWINRQDIEKSDELTVSFDDNNVVEAVYISRGM